MICGSTRCLVLASAPGSTASLTSATLKPAADSRIINYPKPDGVLSFDRLTDLAFSATNHEEDEPVHLKLKDPGIPIAVNLPMWAEPAQRYCPGRGL